MSADLFTVADHCLLARWGMADAPSDRPRSSWPVERVLEAAGDGQLTGPDLADPLAPDELPIQVDGREVTESEARAVADLIVDGDLVWFGTRITLSVHGRALLDRWSRYQRIGGEQ